MAAPPPGPQPEQLPDPALVVLVGAAGAGKSTWASARYRSAEVVSSDALREVVGSGPADLEATDDAFALLDTIVAARLRRGLTTVVDTLGLDPARRAALLAAGRGAGLPCVAVHVRTPAAVCRARNAARDRPVPARALAQQIRRSDALADALAGEGWDRVITVDGSAAPTVVSGSGVAATERGSGLPAAAPPPGGLGDAGPTVGTQIAPSGTQMAPSGTAASAVTGAGSTRRATRRAMAAPTAATPSPAPWPRLPGAGTDYVLNLSAFPWGEDPAGWLTSMAQAADAAGFAGLALMDHLIQIPQVGRAWDPIPEPYVTLGLLAGLDTRLRLGTLVSPVTLRAPGVLAKTLATLDAFTGGRAFCGVGAGWWAREHAAYGLEFPGPGDRLAALERGIETMRTLWAPGTKPYVGAHVALPETTCYPRPSGALPVIVGGNGPRSLRLAARAGDACNLPATGDDLRGHLTAARAACEREGRDPATLAITVLDVTVTGATRDEVATRVERMRGRTAATAYAARHHAGTLDEQRRRHADLAAAGVGTIFLALPGLAHPEEVAALAPLVAGG